MHVSWGEGLREREGDSEEDATPIIEPDVELDLTTPRS